MEKKADLWRRSTGAFFIGAALLMITAGETVLSDRLKQSAWSSVIYWALCFIFTFLAIVVALLDLRIVRRRTRDEQRGLLEETLKEITKEKAAKAGRDGSKHH